MSSSVTLEPSHEPLGSAISTELEEEDDGGEEHDGGERGGEARAADGRPPVAAKRLRGGDGPAEQRDRVRVQGSPKIRRRNRSARKKCEEQRERKGAARRRRRCVRGGLLGASPPPFIGHQASGDVGSWVASWGLTAPTISTTPPAVTSNRRATSPTPAENPGGQ